MYGRSEHTDAVKTITEVASHLRLCRGALQGLRDNLRQDDYERTDAAWQLLRDASVLLADVERQIHKAGEALPTPVADESRWPTREQFNALFRAGGNDAA